MMQALGCLIGVEGSQLKSLWIQKRDKSEIYLSFKNVFDSNAKDAPLSAAD